MKKPPPKKRQDQAAARTRPREALDALSTAAAEQKDLEDEGEQEQQQQDGSAEESSESSEEPKPKRNLNKRKRKEQTKPPSDILELSSDSDAEPTDEPPHNDEDGDAGSEAESDEEFTDAMEVEKPKRAAAKRTGSKRTSAKRSSAKRTGAGKRTGAKRTGRAKKVADDAGGVFVRSEHRERLVGCTSKRMSADDGVDTGSDHAIIDITGVAAVDTQVAQHLLKTVVAARLMGAECIISGIRPQIAQTIVALGIEFGDIATKASLADALRYALNKTRTRES